MKCEAVLEKAMRDETVPWPKSIEELNEYIASLVEREHDYGTCCYAMSMASEATFNYVSHKLGVTGFEASCADLDFLRRTRGMKGPFMIIDAEDMLYPQYDLHAKLNEALTKWRDWARDEAEKKLAEAPNAHPDVVAHWRKLARRA